MSYSPLRQFRLRAADVSLRSRNLSDPEKGVLMCYNCGCQRPNDDMGNPKNITNKTFEEAAKAAGQTPEEAKKNALELLQKSAGK